jgi:hypothetical protein
MLFDSNGNWIPGPSTEFVAWADKKKLRHEGLLEEHVYYAPGPTMFLAHTDDPRAIPVLRRALWSPNFMIEIFAAKVTRKPYKWIFKFPIWQD